MSLTLIAIVIAIVAAFGGMIKAYSAGNTSGEARCESRYVAAEKKAQELEDKLKIEGENHISDMAVAFDVGAAQRQKNLEVTQQKGASDVLRFAVFSNPACTLPAESLANLNQQRIDAFGLRVEPSERPSNVPTTTNPGQVSPAVRSAEPTKGRQDVNSVPGSDPPHRPLGAMQPAPK
jgi:hypothetical protein